MFCHLKAFFRSTKGRLRQQVWSELQPRFSYFFPFALLCRRTSLSEDDTTAMFDQPSGLCPHAVRTSLRSGLNVSKIGSWVLQTWQKSHWKDDWNGDMLSSVSWRPKKNFTQCSKEGPLSAAYVRGPENYLLCIVYSNSIDFIVMLLLNLDFS